MVDLARPVGDARPAVRMLAWSGPDERAWRAAGDALQRWLSTDGPAGFGEAAQRWRPPGRPGPLRSAVLATTRAEAIGAVRAAQPHRGLRRPVALLFPGQGAQHARMGAGLYEREPVFTAAVDRVLELYGP